MKKRKGAEMNKQRMGSGPGRMDNTWDGRSYREVVNGEKIQRNTSDGLKNKTPREEGIEWLVVEVDKCPDIEEKLTRCVVGGVKKGEMLENMDQILTDEASTLVADEGWIDEVADEGGSDDEESSYSPSEDEDCWGDDISDINSESRQEESSHRERSAWMDVLLTKVCSSRGLEKPNHDIGNPPCNSGGLNSLHEKEIHNGTRADDVVTNEKMMELEVEHVDRLQDKRARPARAKFGLENSEAHLGDNMVDEKLDNYEDQWLDSQLMEFAFDELEGKKKCRKVNKLGEIREQSYNKRKRVRMPGSGTEVEA
ncbi:hypothetical protein L1887_29966 [Cichorium endivia]|nr:hypothetical protein L1887_29966 [Cichorium endivia]